MDMKKIVAIIGGGDQDHAFIASTLDKLSSRGELVIIAADRGVEVLNAIGRAPDFLMGDFDSAGAETVAAYARDHEGRTEVFTPEKDFTDTEAAIYKALDVGAEDLWLLGMTGGRLDHFLGTLHNLLIPFCKGIPAVIADPLNEIRLIGRELAADGGAIVAGGAAKVVDDAESADVTEIFLKKSETFGIYVSILPLMDKAEGVSLEGFKYPLKNATVAKGSSLCVSNEIIEEVARISIRRGVMVMVHSR